MLNWGLGLGFSSGWHSSILPLTGLRRLSCVLAAQSCPYSMHFYPRYSKLVVQQIMGRIDAATDNDADVSVDGGFTVGPPPERSVADQCCQ